MNAKHKLTEVYQICKVKCLQAGVDIEQFTCVHTESYGQSQPTQTSTTPQLQDSPSIPVANGML